MRFLPPALITALLLPSSASAALNSYLSIAAPEDAEPALIEEALTAFFADAASAELSRAIDVVAFGDAARQVTTLLVSPSRLTPDDEVELDGHAAELAQASALLFADARLVEEAGSARLLRIGHGGRVAIGHGGREWGIRVVPTSPDLGPSEVLLALAALHSGADTGGFGASVDATLVPGEDRAGPPAGVELVITPTDRHSADKQEINLRVGVEQIGRVDAAVVLGDLLAEVRAAAQREDDERDGGFSGSIVSIDGMAEAIREAAERGAAWEDAATAGGFAGSVVSIAVGLPTLVDLDREELQPQENGGLSSSTVNVLRDDRPDLPELENGGMSSSTVNVLSDDRPDLPELENGGMSSSTVNVSIAASR